MPALTQCPFCGFNGNHGFTHGGRYIGTHFYHDPINDCKGFYKIDKNKHYKTSLEAFLANCPKQEQNTSWGLGRIAELSGRPRQAKKFYDAWKKENHII